MPTAPLRINKEKQMYLSEPSLFELAPSGTNLAVHTEIVDLGRHPNQFNDTGALRHEARLTFRVFPRNANDGMFAVSATITPPLSKIEISRMGRKHARAPIDVRRVLSL